MKFIADLHIHSHLSRATSRDLVPEFISLWAQKKGIKVVGTGDFTHPAWVRELREKLVETQEGLYCLKQSLRGQVERDVPVACRDKTRFILSGEISCIYKKNGKTRKIHHLILMPNLDSVERLNARLAKIGNITSDGRPILGLDSRDLLETVLETDEKAFFIPAHIWTPWFSLFGSKSGFDSLEECFEDLSHHIHALETGLSSDPPMNRLLSALDPYVLVSNSDAHSPAKLGREANIFDTELDYPHIIKAMTHGKGFLGTVEFFPEEGKYHLDGHRKCGIRLEPRETIKRGKICPKCGKPITVGVLYRVEELADRSNPVLSKDFFSLIPLPEILSEILGCGPSTKKVLSFYEKLLQELGPELNILLDVPLDAIEQKGGVLLKEGIKRMRQNRVIKQGGFDGQYGLIRLFHENEKEAISGQNTLFGQPINPKPQRAIHRAKKKTSSITFSEALSKKGQDKLSEDPILGPLNDSQRKAVTHGRGHLLVVAGPGTGKTMTLTHRIAYLINSGKAKPEEILALTFTRKAATEMAERLRSLMGQHNDQSIYVSTFHSFCLDVLQDQAELCDLPLPLRVCPQLDAERIAKQVISDSGKGKISVARFFRLVFDLKMKSFIPGKGVDIQDFNQEIFDNYSTRLKDLGLLDMEDLIVETLKLFMEQPEICGQYAARFPWVFVDEYQDTNPAQVLLIKLLGQAGEVNVFAIGDPDQAIYGFRGADVKGFFSFEQDFPGATKIVLTRNYRSTQNVLDAAACILDKDSSLESTNGKGPPVFYSACRTEQEEAEMIVEAIEKLMGGVSYFSLDSGRVEGHEQDLAFTFGDFAVLFRLNAQGDVLEEALTRRGIPIVRSGGLPLINQYPVEILWRYLQYLLDPANTYYQIAYKECLRRYHIDIPLTGGHITLKMNLSQLIGHAITIHGLTDLQDHEQSILEDFQNMASEFEGDLGRFLAFLSLERGIDNQNLMGDRVALMSLHAAKGLEWPVVFITGCEDKLLPCTIFGEKDEDEERRLFYVGMTRARKRLILSWAKKRNLHGRVMKMSPTPFFEKITDRVLQELPRLGWRPKPKAHKQLDLFSA